MSVHACVCVCVHAGKTCIRAVVGCMYVTESC